MFQLGAQIALLGFNPTLIKYISGDGMAPWATLARVAKALVPSAVVVGLTVGVCAHSILGLSLGSSLAVGIVLCLECWLVLAFVTARAASMPIIFSSALILRASAILASLALIIYVQPALVRRAGDVPVIWILIYLVVGLTLGALIKAKSKTGEAPDRKALRGGLKYGFPLLITIVLSQVMQTTDRFLVSGFLGFDDAGVYFLHAKIANALAFAALPVQLWWPVARFEHLKDGDGGALFFSQASVWGIAFFGVAAIGLAAIAPHLLRWFAPSLEFKSLLFLVLLLSVFFQTSSYFFQYWSSQRGGYSLECHRLGWGRGGTDILSASSVGFVWGDWRCTWGGGWIVHCADSPVPTVSAYLAHSVPRLQVGGNFDCVDQRVIASRRCDPMSALDDVQVRIRIYNNMCEFGTDEIQRDTCRAGWARTNGFA